LLYRQLLNPARNGMPAETTAPFIKMMSQSTSQRSTLIPDNSLYYLDTTVDTATQKAAGAVNLSVFEPGKSYHVFTIFSKPTSKVTFQIFIGKGLSESYIMNNVVAEVGDAGSGQMSFSPLGFWPTGWSTLTPGVPDYNATTGILTVPLDLSAKAGSGFAAAYNASIQGRCQPTSFCSWNSMASQCQCNTAALSMPNNPFNYLLGDCQADNSNICSYATKDIDYPDDPDPTRNPGRTKGAAFGFRLTLPAACEGTDQNCFATRPTQAERDALRPPPSCFPSDMASGWNVPFVPTTGTLAGDCTYNSAPPSPMFCTNPAPAPVPMSLNDYFQETRPHPVALAEARKK
jgi:hypothetical protein